jgi:hypothetical protein
VVGFGVAAGLYEHTCACGYSCCSLGLTREDGYYPTLLLACKINYLLEVEMG